MCLFRGRNFREILTRVIGRRHLDFVQAGFFTAGHNSGQSSSTYANPKVFEDVRRRTCEGGH